MREEWKSIEGYEEEYAVSSYGSIKSFKRKGNPRTRILKPKTLERGYKIVALCKNKLRCEKLVHRLVLETFIGECPIGMEGCHLDSDPTNNRLDNLKWDTHKNNMAESIRRGTFHYNCGHYNRGRRKE